jgi:hypothetical protein
MVIKTRTSCPTETNGHVTHRKFEASAQNECKSKPSSSYNPDLHSPVHFTQLLQSRYQYTFLPTSAVTNFNCYRPLQTLFSNHITALAALVYILFFKFTTHSRNIIVLKGSLSLLPAHQHEDIVHNLYFSTNILHS